MAGRAVPIIANAVRIERLLTVVGDGTGQSEQVTNMAITDAINAAPIAITSNGHGLVTGDKVSIANVEGNTAANGNWTVTKINANGFSLDGSTGNGAYTQNGEWWFREYKVSPSNTLILEYLNVYVEDATAFRADYYGGGALTNGIRVYVKDTDDVTIVELTALPVKKIGHWGLLAGAETEFGLKPGTGSHLVLAQIDLEGLPIKGDAGEYLLVEIADCLGTDGAGLDSQYMTVRGRSTEAALDFS